MVCKNLEANVLESWEKGIWKIVVIYIPFLERFLMVDGDTHQKRKSDIQIGAKHSNQIYQNFNKKD